MLDVTIVIPVRNEADGIVDLLNDLLAQTARPRAIHVVDTGSTDATADLVLELASRHELIRLLRDDGGLPGSARNVGVRAATTAWIAFIDGGMRVASNWLFDLVEAQEHAPDDPDVVLGSFDPDVSDSERRATAIAYVPARRPCPGGGDWRGFCLPSSLFRRSTVLAVGGFPTALRAAEDHVFWRRVVDRHPKIAYAPTAKIVWAHAHRTKDVWRRFRTYAFHSCVAGEMRTWFDVMARRHIAISVLSGPLAPLAISASWAARALVSMKRKPDLLPPSVAAWPEVWLRTSIALGLIDLATWDGWLEWLKAGRPVERVGHAP